MDAERSAATAEALKGRAEALLAKFRAFATAPKAGAAGSAASGGGADKSNPDANLDDLLEPVDIERSAAAAEAMKGRAEALLAKFRAFSIGPERGAASSTAAGGGAGQRDPTTSDGAAKK